MNYKKEIFRNSITITDLYIIDKLIIELLNIQFIVYTSLFEGSKISKTIRKLIYF